MGSSYPKIWFILFFPFFLLEEGNAQGIGEKPLRDVLDQLEEQFSVRFSYMDQTIDSIQVQLPGSDLDLDQALDHLESQVAIDFIKLDESFISIRRLITIVKICGYLLDKDDGSSVSDALIFSQSTSTTSDQNGYFELANAEIPLKVLISHVSYQDLVLRFDNSSEECIKSYLTPSTERLEEVIIKNYITRGIDKRDNGKTVVDVQNTNILPGLTEPDIFFTLQNLPGIQSMNETVTDINIRGGSNDQNLILWDGLRLYQTGHFFGLISAINPHIIGKTTLMKNGTPARLGEGVSGTIQVETRKKSTSEITAHAGSNLINSDLLLEVPTDKLHLLIASRQSIGGIFNTPTYDQYFDRAFRFSDVINDPSSQVINSDEKFSFYDFSFNATYKLSSTAGIKGGVLGLDNGISYEESDLVSNRVESKVSNLDQGTIAGYLSYDQRWSDRLKTKLYSSIMDYRQESVNFDVLTGQEHILDNEVLEETIRAEGSYFLNDTWDVAVGIQLVETGIRNFRDINLPAFRSLSKEVLRTSSLYMEGNAQLQTHTTIAAGIRANYFDKLDQYRIEPRLAMSTRLGGSFSLEVLAETKSQTTVQVVDFQTDFLGVENRKWVLVNGENIPLLTSGQASVGVNYQKKSLLVSLEGFIKGVDGVVTASQGFLNQFQFERTFGSYVSRGIELLVNPSFGNLDSWVTYSYLNSDYTFSDLVPPEFRNNFDISHALSVGLTYQLNNLELSSGVNYRSGMPFTEPQGIDKTNDEIVFDFPNAMTLDNYFRMDFSAKYKFVLSDNWSGNCGIAIWNITNKDNTIKTLTSITEDGELSQINQKALGITPNLSVRVAHSF
ncbi:TonB-dependent receptor plug domain-containing protein [Imperialibacter roseus]|uniref:TonB-dependent receptor plug domain-containing protein n=1 Tax=Imperialibacter roseus TaxID=1324217 RepID=A0ABZ0IRK6_9BACT|nr:TonB-dependent receptor plug domain-containing protein [Imperialibacter roseus]WOK07211.1 TonB-dependent receptor plug domain-containing protein [Imperialibacter roseus]